MKARFPGVCVHRECGRRFPVGTEIVWVARDKATYHEVCWAKRDEQPTVDPEDGLEVGSYRWDPALFTGDKLAQWHLLAIRNEFWDGEDEIRLSAARQFSAAYDAGTWVRLYEDHRGWIVEDAS